RRAAAQLAGLPNAARVCATTRGDDGGGGVSAAIALELLSPRLAGTRQGCATPRPAAAPLTEPVQPRKATGYEGDGRVPTAATSPDRLTFQVDGFWGQVRSPISLTASYAGPGKRPNVVPGVDAKLD